MRTYQVQSGRFDIAFHVIGRFKVVGDRVARERFEKRYKENPNYAWAWLKLERVTKRGKVTLIATNHKKED